MYLLPLVMSAVVIISVHAYLLVSLRTHRKWTISEHAALRRRTLVVYALAHFIGGLSFLLFAKRYYIDVQHINWLFYLTAVTVTFEYIQALLPARGETAKAHTKVALIMWLLLLLLGFLSVIFLPVDIQRKGVAMSLYAGIFGCLAYASKNRSKLYLNQMLVVGLFYLALFVLVV